MECNWRHVKVDGKGRLIIPKEVRKMAGICPDGPDNWVALRLTPINYFTSPPPRNEDPGEIKVDEWMIIITHISLHGTTRAVKTGGGDTTNES